MNKLKETIILNGILPVTDVIFRTNITRWIKKINSMFTWTPLEIKKWQTEKMKELIKNAYEYSNYYHELFDSLNLLPTDINTIDDLEKIPPLTKDIIRKRYNDILLKNSNDYHYKYSSSGGSTGLPVKFIRDNNSWGFTNAYGIIMKKTTGYRYGDKFLAMGYSSIFPTDKMSLKHKLYYQIQGKIPFVAMDMSDSRLNDCVQLIIKKNLHYIYGYPSALLLLAKYVKENRLENRLHIKVCFSTSELLPDTYKQFIENVFNCVVLDCYGAGDGGVTGYSYGKKFKVGYNCIIQLDKTENNANPNLGTALLTDVTNMVFPMIRYRHGDILEIDEGYNNFHNGQVLKRVLGRTSDAINLENGHTLLPGGFADFFRDVNNVVGYRFVKSGYMELTVIIVKTPDYTEQEENKIIQTLQAYTGEGCKIVIKYTDKIENRRNGKNLFFLNADSETNTAD